jgi:uncharacterized membrane protein YbhN (UPF0104 family)
LSYIALTGYDTLGLKYTGCKLEYSKTALTSFISFVISNNFGFLKVAGFCLVTFWQGVFFLGGLSLIWDPLPLPPLLPAALHFNPRMIGLLLLAGFSVYFLLAIFFRKPFRFRDVEISAPRPSLVIGQVWVSTFDWVAAGGAGIFEASILFLLPHQVPRSELFAALVAYRAVYYLGPLGVASLLFSGFELFHKRTVIRKSYA